MPECAAGDERSPQRSSQFSRLSSQRSAWRSAASHALTAAGDHETVAAAVRVVLFGVVACAACLLALACSGDGPAARLRRNGGDGSSAIPSFPPSCTPDESCTCGLREGRTRCEGTASICECENCPTLEFTDPPTASCGGQPIGAWRLTGVTGGRRNLDFTPSVAACESNLDITASEVPRVLMHLLGGGSASYYGEQVPALVSWSNECVMAHAGTGYDCDSGAALGDCELDCDVCRCNSFLPMLDRDNAHWERTESKLRISLWGGPEEGYDYCVEGDTLKLSAPGLRATFERIHPFGLPTPCSDRPPEQCAAGGSCVQGACVGGMNCLEADSEGTCLTLPGCSWDSTQCTGNARTCKLEDYEVVPGCVLTDEALACRGTPLPCEGRPLDTCVAGEGCRAVDFVTCTGEPTPCSEFALEVCRLAIGCDLVPLEP